jgi:hypothetical protein
MSLVTVKRPPPDASPTTVTTSSTSAKSHPIITATNGVTSTTSSSKMLLNSCGSSSSSSSSSTNGRFSTLTATSPTQLPVNYKNVYFHTASSNPAQPPTSLSTSTLSKLNNGSNALNNQQLQSNNVTTTATSSSSCSSSSSSLCNDQAKVSGGSVKAGLIKSAKNELLNRNKSPFRSKSKLVVGSESVTTKNSIASLKEKYSATSAAATTSTGLVFNISIFKTVCIKK